MEESLGSRLSSPSPLAPEAVEKEHHEVLEDSVDGLQLPVHEPHVSRSRLPHDTKTTRYIIRHLRHHI